VVAAAVAAAVLCRHVFVLGLQLVPLCAYANVRLRHKRDAAAALRPPLWACMAWSAVLVWCSCVTVAFFHDPAEVVPVLLALLVTLVVSGGQPSTKDDDNRRTLTAVAVGGGVWLLQLLAVLVARASGTMRLNVTYLVLGIASDACAFVLCAVLYQRSAHVTDSLSPGRGALRG
jgi:hypothetical protein